MAEIDMVVRGGVLAPLDALGSSELAKFRAHTVVAVKVSQRRSRPHHNFFFAFLAEVFDNWPAFGRDGLPIAIAADNVEHLRAWLTVKAGWRDYLEFSFNEGEEGAAAVAGAVIHDLFRRERTRGIYVWVKVTGSTVGVARPKSIKFASMSEKEFILYTESVFSLIYNMTGMDADEYKERWEREIKSGNRRRAKKMDSPA